MKKKENKKISLAELLRKERMEASGQYAEDPAIYRKQFKEIRKKFEKTCRKNKPKSYSLKHDLSFAAEPRVRYGRGGDAAG